MQLMGDAVTVLGSRLGMGWDPKARQAYLIRHGLLPGIPMEIKAGVEIEGRWLVLPLSTTGETFEFLDQEMSPTAMSLSGIDPKTGIHVKLHVRIPFRPRDDRFSTTPALFLEFTVDRLSSNFRWTGQQSEPVQGRLFLEISGKAFATTFDAMGADVSYQTTIIHPEKVDPERWSPELILKDENIPCRDRWAVLSGTPSGNGFEVPFKLERGAKGPRLAFVWCSYDQAILNVRGEKAPFKYTQWFKGLQEVVDWAVKHEAEVIDNSTKVDGLLQKHSLGASVSHLMAQTLHAWLMNTWWTVRPDGSDWFSVWEGSCYFHSTVDVEYTQGPFYLSVWPELLEMELHEWPYFGKDGAGILGEKGAGTLFLSHDIGQHADCDGQCYPHEMEVEENANYLLLAFAHWRRTGKDDVLKRHAGFMRKLLDFIVACDSTGNGIPDQGCANTIDDASPAIQFGSEQVYLAVKAMAACEAGRLMLAHVGESDIDKYKAFVQKAKETVEELGWKDDHYVVTLSRTLDGIINPWSGQAMHGELEGWDAYHIYTTNGLALLDMVGYEPLLDPERLRQDIRNATPRTLGKYGCRHTSYVSQKPTDLLVPGLAGSAPQVGWVSMNMFRDIAAAYRGIDLFDLSDCYWDWQCTTNTQKFAAFFETFYGNNLHFYPRGIAIYGYFEAAAGFVYDACRNYQQIKPVRSNLQVPLLYFADWRRGTAPMVQVSMNGDAVSASIQDMDATN
jgi:hypothetical protein